jgi:phosphatidylserine/phosphatidylglycerophosphate/cardiolipin synthase-like enzyme
LGIKTKVLRFICQLILSQKNGRSRYDFSFASENMLRAVVFSLFFATPFLQAQAQAPAQIQIYFSPGDKPTTAIVETLKKAKKTIHVQAYSFTSAPIAEALREAHWRGVKCQVILDKSQQSEKYTVATFLRNAGIEVWIDRKHAIAHNKIMIIDGSTVITGSFNFTKAAEERNAENLLIIRDSAVAQIYMNNWNEHLRHSEK